MTKKRPKEAPVRGSNYDNPKIKREQGGVYWDPEDRPRHGRNRDQIEIEEQPDVVINPAHANGHGEP